MFMLFNFTFILILMGMSTGWKLHSEEFFNERRSNAYFQFLQREIRDMYPEEFSDSDSDKTSSVDTDDISSYTESSETGGDSSSLFSSDDGGRYLYASKSVQLMGDAATEYLNADPLRNQGGFFTATKPGVDYSYAAGGADPTGVTRQKGNAVYVADRERPDGRTYEYNVGMNTPANYPALQQNWHQVREEPLLGGTGAVAFQAPNRPKTQPGKYYNY